MTNKICGWAKSSTGKDGIKQMPTHCQKKGCDGYNINCDHYKDIIEISQCNCVRVISGKHLYKIEEENKCSDKNCRRILQRLKDIIDFMGE